MWTVVYLAPNCREAERVKNLLTAEGFVVQTKKICVGNDGNGPVGIMVPESEAGEALEVIHGQKIME
ncbi:MAG: glutamate decarboxylase [Peptococcaceae bacterium]|jgi:hypothetical protein|nr:glutamate decarboxylase [Peptococcaceae bacterium]